MPVTVVVGAQWGDEGKAKVIDLLASEHTHVVRYQGGHNAGHTVVVGTSGMRCSSCPSGVLYPHIIPVIGNGVVVDMPTLFNEIDTLEGRGISCAKLKVSSQAHLIFPWHQTLDALYEDGRGDARIGTTLKGIGPAYADKARREGMRAGEVLDPAAFAATVKQRAVSHNAEIVALGGEPLDVDEVVDQFAALGRRLAPYVVDTVELLHDALDRDDTCCSKARRRRSSTSTTARIRSSPRRTRRPAARASAPASARGTSHASSASPRRTRPVSAAGRFPPSCSTRSATSSSTSGTSSARSPGAAGAPVGSTA